MGVLCWTVSALSHLVRPITSSHAATYPPPLLNADTLNSAELIRLALKPVTVPHSTRGIGRAVRKVIRQKLGIGHHSAQTIWRTAIVCSAVTPLALLGAPLIEHRYGNSLWLGIPTDLTELPKSGDNGEEWSDTDGRRCISAAEPTSLVIFGISVLIAGAAAKHQRQV
jgi:hypothetical protein